MNLKKYALVLLVAALFNAHGYHALAEGQSVPSTESPTAGSHSAEFTDHSAQAEPPAEENAPSAASYVPPIDTSNKEMSDWAAQDADWMVANNIVPVQLQFNYKSNITREEFSSLAVAVLDFMSEGRIRLIHAQAENKFEDTENIDVYKAYSYGIVNGVSEKEFKPGSAITRQEAAVMMANLLKSIQAKNLSTEDSKYDDRLSIADWALDSVDITSNIKLFQGTDIGFRPYDNYTREQAIVVMRRLLGFEGHAHMVSLRGRVAVHLEDLGTSEDAKANKARPMAVLTGTSSVKFVWTEAMRTGAAYARLFKDESGHQHMNVVPFSQEALDKLEAGESTVRDGEYTLILGNGTQQKGYLLGIVWQE
jgi:hypothetical protein